MLPLTRSQLVGYGVLAVAVLVVGGRWLASRTPHDQRPVAAATRPAAVAVRAPARAVLVHVAGAVRRPGVYRLRAGDRVQEAVRRAGGPARGADVDGLNLAAPVEDGVRLVVPTRAGVRAAAAAAPGTAAPGTASPGAANVPVDLNSATAAELDTLDGVGPATAAKILEYRRRHGGFRSVDDLGEVPGIGPKKLAALRSRVRT